MHQLLVLSDIHGNLSALESVMRDAEKNYCPDSAVILGDNIDYCMRSNEVLEVLESFKIPIIASLWGNHEYAIMNEDYTCFSSQRGIEAAKYTRKNLSAHSFRYLNCITGKKGILEFQYGGKCFLAVHGSLENPFWKSININMDLSNYQKYDYILSGHSHIPHDFSVFFESNNKDFRNKKRTVFINPGSVGQPRNHDSYAQYAIVDFSHGVFMRRVKYDIKFEQNLFTDDIDSFYSERLKKGV